MDRFLCIVHRFLTIKPMDRFLCIVHRFLTIKPMDRFLCPGHRLWPSNRWTDFCCKKPPAKQRGGLGLWWLRIATAISIFPFFVESFFLIFVAFWLNCVQEFLYFIYLLNGTGKMFYNSILCISFVDPQIRAALYVTALRKKRFFIAIQQRFDAPKVFQTGKWRLFFFCTSSRGGIDTYFAITPRTRKSRLFNPIAVKFASQHRSRVFVVQYRCRWNMNPSCCFWWTRWKLPV